MAGTIIPEKLHTPWLSITAFVYVLAFAPLAMNQVPHPSVYEPGVWPAMEAGLPTADTLQNQLAISGIVCGSVALGEFGIMLLPKLKRRSRFWLNASLAFSSMIIGFRTYPYWAYGIYQRNIDGVRWADMDPKPLLEGPFEILWAYWSWGLLSLTLTLPFTSAAVLWIMVSRIRQREFTHVLIMGCIVLPSIIVFFGFSPRLMDWFFD